MLKEDIKPGRGEEGDFKIYKSIHPIVILLPHAKAAIDWDVGRAFATYIDRVYDGDLCR